MYHEVSWGSSKKMRCMMRWTRHRELSCGTRFSSYLRVMLLEARKMASWSCCSFSPQRSEVKESCFHSSRRTAWKIWNSIFTGSGLNYSHSNYLPPWSVHVQYFCILRWLRNWPNASVWISFPLSAAPEVQYIACYKSYSRQILERQTHKV